ncbi:hypothetical protein PFICI_09829 [Pestalotiopsis fici W106-1]|uniref:Uncharacterized protein n=1 Tax=Pestalotiopsis fici (strain W106-1 / CGMCC3.15140) TaxID=1229662 RepID=W3WXD7_PESFW|nr:uncharacterized protein PFICI_09829 [Pestalotiopsis fici W106-1]ETS77767.1 hypothetical protein PFICI_09829 [Pestalotiopsis fici W106-1]
MIRSTSVKAKKKRDPDLSRDRFIDKTYVKDGSNIADYVKAPFENSKNPLASYLSLRFAEKDGFLKELEKASPEDWDRVNHEIGRIQSDRQKFSDDFTKKRLNDELQQSYSNWKKTVFNAAELRQIGLDREKQVKKLPASEASTRELRTWDSKHLKQLKDVVDGENPSPDLGHASRSFSASRHLPPQPRAYDPYHGFRAGVMYFKKLADGSLEGFDSNNEKYKDTRFPNQKIALKDILDDPNKNPLSEERPDDEVRYFHFPSNNMEWIEKAIKQYYSRRNISNSSSKDCDRVLSREYWTGQMHGGGPVGHTSDFRRTAPVHSRHMRSKCSLIPREARPRFRTSQSTDHIPTSSGPQRAPQRAISVGVPLGEKNVAIFLPYLHWETSSRRAQMVKVINEAIGTNSKASRREFRLPQAVEEVMKMKRSKNGTSIKNKVPRVRRKQYLARYLFAVARMAEEIDHAADEKLLRHKVNNHSPLHVRRTLDQYYFLTLDNTSERDRDQVVYRGTRSLSLTTRVVMVDQLWMWILDDNTIITSFPRRWGRNKPDPSGVHKSLRIRLGQRTEVIKSIHHLAMIIMDQCSRVFFDRTRPLDQRPEVMDLFAEAIGTVTERTRIAYNHFWRFLWQEQHYRGQLKVNVEGVVFKEAQDIAEELMIMKRVYCEQLKVAKDFMRHLTHTHGRHAAKLGDALLINKFISELKKTMAKDTEDEDDETLELATRIDEESVHEAHDLIETLQARLGEIADLEEAALRACTQLEGFLSLKQQQASIIDARSALDMAKESYKQGRTIQAFTIVTIIFLPLSFIAAFFGMNNIEINNAPWMSLWQQIKWMFGGTAVVIFISISLAFGSWVRVLAVWLRGVATWIRAVLRLAFQVSRAKLFQDTEITILHGWWGNSVFNSKNIDSKREILLADIALKRRQKIYNRAQRMMDIVEEEEEEEEERNLSQRLSEFNARRRLPERHGRHIADDPDPSYKGILQHMTRVRFARKEDGTADTNV